MELKHIARRPGRLSSFLKAELGMSTGLMNRMKWQDRLFVNGIPCHADHPILPGDVITVPLDAEPPQYPAQEGPLSILYEDEYLLAVDKPAGLLIHPSRAALTGTLANFVLGYYEKTGQSCAFHPVTRLDRDTYGIVLLAKNPHIHARLNDLHSAGLLRKTYRALTFGGPEAASGRVDAPIARRPLPSLLRFVSPEGKPSATEFAVVQRRGDITQVTLRPVTGRTHQLRVHMAYLGCPILGDPQYGNEASLAASAALGLSSQQLCARALDFPHPVTGAEMHLESRLDADFPIDLSSII